MKSNKGFSFIELNMAIVLFIIAVLSTMGILTYCTLANKKTSELSQCTHLVQSKMAELMYMNADQIAEAPTPVSFPSPFENYHFTVKKTDPADSRLSGLKEVKITAIGSTGVQVSLFKLAQTGEVINDFLYQLQYVDLTQIGNNKFDLVIMDFVKNVDGEIKFTADEIRALQNSPGGHKVVLSYMSVGEAETYRWYWNPDWVGAGGNLTSLAPSWLGPLNPDWGSYKTKYWEPGWKAIIYGTPNSNLDKIIDAGFDGVYLDIIDAYEYWGPGGGGGLNRETAAREMVDFVKEIAYYARVIRGKPNFMVFPQNGQGLAVYPDYVAAVNGIGRESTWYSESTPNDPEVTDAIIADLDIFKRAGKLILCTDYVADTAKPGYNPANIDDFYAKAKAKGYIPYSSTRLLDIMTINPGHEPD